MTLAVTLFLAGDYFMTLHPSCPPIPSQQQPTVKHDNYPGGWSTWEETNVCINVAPPVLPPDRQPADDILVNLLVLILIYAPLNGRADIGWPKTFFKCRGLIKSSPDLKGTLQNVEISCPYTSFSWDVLASLLTLPSGNYSLPGVDSCSDHSLVSGTYSPERNEAQDM